MITTYTIEVPCSCCGKMRQVKLKGYCSGSCKVKAFREKNNVQEIVYNETVVSPVITKKSKNEIPLNEKISISSLLPDLPQFLDKPREGYHYSPMLGKFVKD
jgi:hypothetical protein